jgi:hypothetical protein
MMTAMAGAMSKSASVLPSVRSSSPSWRLASMTSGKRGFMQVSSTPSASSPASAWPLGAMEPE